MNTPIYENPEWNTYFLNIAKTVSSKSKDPTTKVGAVIVGERGEIRTTGYNGFVRGANDDPELYMSRDKYDFMVHAETNAIFNAARFGVSIYGCYIYIYTDSKRGATYGPCLNCAMSIIQVGISAIVTPKIVGVPDHWLDNMNRAMALLGSTGVKLLEVSL